MEHERAFCHGPGTGSFSILADTCLYSFSSRFSSYHRLPVLLSLLPDSSRYQGRDLSLYPETRCTAYRSRTKFRNAAERQREGKNVNARTESKREIRRSLCGA